MNAADLVAEAAPTAAYFRAFNTLGWEVLDSPVVGGTRADMFFCGPDGPPRVAVEQLIGDVGLRPVWIGGPEAADVVDGMLRLWLTIVMKQGHSRRLAFKLLDE
jgi:predicted dinucleotide-binding enzyme